MEASATAGWELFLAAVAGAAGSLVGRIGKGGWRRSS